MSIYTNTTQGSVFLSFNGTANNTRLGVLLQTDDPSIPHFANENGTPLFPRMTSFAPTGLTGHWTYIALASVSVILALLL